MTHHTPELVAGARASYDHERHNHEASTGIRTYSWEQLSEEGRIMRCQAFASGLAALLPVSKGGQRAAQAVDMMGSHAKVFPHEFAATINHIIGRDA